MVDGLTPEAEKVLDKVQKLFNLAEKAGTPEEAEAATVKAQALMLEHNLTTATLEKRSGESGKRMQDMVEGGFYRYQRELWEEVARLNFCLHWVHRKRVEVKNIRRKNSWESREYGGEKPTYKFDGTVRRRFHMLVGRQANVKATVGMANYLLASVERLTRETCAEKKLDVMSRWAMSFREGCVYNLTQRLWDRRKDAIAAEEKARREAFERAARSGASASTALTISTYVQQEVDANYDFLEGKELGTNARERAESAAAQRQREEAYTRWAKANPEEAKAKAEADDAEREKRAARSRKRGGGSDFRYGSVDSQAFWAGEKLAKKIGLDPQADHSTKEAKRIGRA
jgi:hypothetical protein